MSEEVNNQIQQQNRSHGIGNDSMIYSLNYIGQGFAKKQQ